MSILDVLRQPLIAAPMAGGPSTPALAKAVSRAGGLGFLAGGVMTPSQLAADLAGMEGNYGLNLFAAQAPLPDLGAVEEIRRELIPAYRAAGLGVPELPRVDYSNGWREKIDLALRAPHPPAVLSATFGPFTPAENDTLHAAGIETWVTVSNPRDAARAVRQGADALVVQGPEAGGHRSTWSVAETPDERALPELLRDIAKLSPGVPLIAAGGISTPARVAEILRLPGVRAVSCGTAFLLGTEAGTSAANRRILAGARETVATRAFSGRVARGVASPFTRRYPEFPAIYPYLNALLKPLRADPGHAYCLAGAGVADIREMGAAEILAHLLGETSTGVGRG